MCRKSERRKTNYQVLYEYTSRSTSSAAVYARYDTGTQQYNYAGRTYVRCTYCTIKIICIDHNCNVGAPVLTINASIRRGVRNGAATRKTLMDVLSVVYATLCMPNCLISYIAYPLAGTYFHSCWVVGAGGDVKYARIKQTGNTERRQK